MASEKKNAREFEKTRRRCREDNPIFRLFCWCPTIFYSWVTPYLVKGYRTRINFEDFPELAKENLLKKYERRFDGWWKFYGSACVKKWRLLGSLLGFVGIEYAFSGLLYVFSVVIIGFVPKVMQMFLYNIAPLKTDVEIAQLDRSRMILPDELKPSVDVNWNEIGFRENNWVIFVYMTLFVVMNFAYVVIQQYSLFVGAKCALKVRGVLLSKIYKKALRMSNKDRKNFDDGKILNHCSSDVGRIEKVLTVFHTGWTAFFTLGISIFFLSELIGWSTLYGYAVWMVSVPTMLLTASILFSIKGYILTLSDTRVSSILEVVKGISVIKWFTWEEKYLERIYDIRNKEITLYRIVAVLFSAMLSVIQSSNRFVPVVAFITYYLVNQRLDPITVFTSLSYFSILRPAVNLSVMVITQTVEALLSVERIQKILNAEEYIPIVKKNNTEFPVIVDHGYFKWEKSKKKKTKTKGRKKKFKLRDLCKRKKKEDTELSAKDLGKLEDINLKIKKGSLVMIVGKVGSGKSSLLNAFVGAMKKESGNLEISGSFSFSSQNPYLLNATVQNNILFGRKYDKELLDKCVDVCCLKADLDVIRGGLQAEIGERGINTSGGQAYRIQLARSCYTDAETIILDDPLAAVDAHVGAKIFRDCINGILRRKTRIVVTHQLQYAAYADHVIVMEDGKIAEQGQYTDLISKKGKLFSMITVKTEKKEQQESKKSEEGDDEKEKNEGNNTIIQAEERQTGTISWKVVKSYMSSMGWKTVVVSGVLFVIAQAFLSATDYFLMLWSSGKVSEKFGNSAYTSYYYNMSSNLLMDYDQSSCFPTNCSFCFEEGIFCKEEYVDVFWDYKYENETIIEAGLPDMTCMMIYLGLGVVSAFVIFIKSYMFVNAGITATKKMHNRAVLSLMFGKMGFFESNKTGRIVSRFSHDVGQMDFSLLLSINIFLLLLFVFVGYAVQVSIVTYGFFVIVILVAGVIYLLLYLFFRKPNLDIKRIDSIRRSPLIAGVEETLNGISVIRAYEMETEFETINLQRINDCNKTFLMTQAASCWVNVRLGVLGTFVVSSVSIMCILLYFFSPVSWGISVGLISLALTNSVSINSLFNKVTTQATATETAFNCVERVDHYIKNIPQEPKTGKKFPKKVEGRIEFRSYSMRYRKELPLVLKNVSLTIHAKEKIGIVGRTGSGKSSMIMGLFRFKEPASGTIFIDGIDFKTLSLKALRSSIAIIPQQPVLFSGTVKSNLDPFEEHEDFEIFEALKKTMLFDKINSMEHKLLSPVEEDGKNFSAGEKQLLCLARAQLASCSVLVLDEPTSSVDFKTDEYIQDSIRECFKDCTVITIAHRINTICGSDRIIGLDDGKLVEFDTPKNLLTNKRYSLFRSLVKESGDESAKEIFEKVVGKQKKASLISDDVNKSIQESIAKFQKLKTEITKTLVQL